MWSYPWNMIDFNFDNPGCIIDHVHYIVQVNPRHEIQLIKAVVMYIIDIRMYKFTMITIQSSPYYSSTLRDYGM